MHMRPSFERILSPLRLPVSPRSRQGFQRLFADRCKSEPGNGWETPGASGRQSPEKVPNPRRGISTALAEKLGYERVTAFKPKLGSDREYTLPTPEEGKEGSAR